jgi:ParB family chromosome partitioning protein
MNTIENTTTQPRLIAVSKLEKSPLNARRTVRPDGFGELKASILAHGLMQNLVVTDAGDGAFLVIAGGRRLEAIRSLQGEGKLPEDFAVPCQVVTEANAQEMSLAENTIRLAMHPADQFQTFAELIDKGQTAADVAERLGIEESLVHKRMKLARVAPDLLEVYRNDGMTLECLMAFTVTDDHRRQLKVYKSLQDWQKDDPSAIRDTLTEKMVDASSKLALFVGLDAYTAAGGNSRADLFGEEVYLEKPALLNRLAEKKLDGIRRELEAEGWGWIEINPERDYTLINRCTRIPPQLIDAPSELLAFKQQLDAELEAIEAVLEDTESDELLDQQQAVRGRIDEVEEKLAAFVGFDAEQKRLAGCFVSIGQDGTPFLDKGLVKPEQRKQLARLLKTDGSDGEPDRAKPKNPLPETLRRDLAAYRLQVAQVEIARHPAIAFDLLVFQVASKMLDEHPVSDGPDVQFKRPRLTPTSGKEPTASGDAFVAIAKLLPDGWRKPKSEADRFDAFRLLPQADKLDLLAYCVALTLQPKLAPADGDEATSYDTALALTEASVASYWRPGKDSYLRRISRDQLLTLARDTLGEEWVQLRATDKKALLVDQLDRAFADPAKYGRTPEQVDKLKSWLPTGMAFGTVPTLKPAKASKARKVA